MQEEKIVQFVSFETILTEEQFVSRWAKFTRSDYGDKDVLLHQSETSGGFKYLAAYRYTGGFKFIFEKERRSSKDPQVSIKVVQEGGYLILHIARRGDCRSDESKVFCFIQNPETDLRVYKEMSVTDGCNIYSAYYENCRFAYILEFFAKSEQVKQLLEKLTRDGFDQVAVYRECVTQLS